jgi:hypothetical protein
MRESQTDTEVTDSLAQPYPALRRVAFLAALRRGTDQLLTIGYESPTLPAAVVGPAADYLAVAHQLASRLLLERTVVWGDTSACIAAPTAEAAGVPGREARLFFLRGVPKALLPWRWINPGEVPELELRLGIPDLATVIEGYLAGWTPDGLITLG